MVGDEQARRVRFGLREPPPGLGGPILGFFASQIWAGSPPHLKTRSLCTVAALTALGRTSALELNVRMASGNGATKEEIVEAILQMAPYAGFPAVWDGLQIASRVLNDIQPA